MQHNHTAIFLMAPLWLMLSGAPEWFIIVGLAGMISLVLGTYLAMFQQDLKGLLAPEPGLPACLGPLPEGKSACWNPVHRHVMGTLRSKSNGWNAARSRAVCFRRCARVSPAHGLPASEGRTRSQPVEWTASNGHIRSMVIPGNRKKYLVVSASLLTRS